MNRWAGFALWAVSGSLLAVSAAGALTIGPLVFPVAIAALVVAAVLTRGTGGAGVLVGPGLVAGYIAWLNREGPGTICHAIENGMRCTEEWNPWPIAAVAIALVALAVAVTVRRRPSALR